MDVIDFGRQFESNGLAGSESGGERQCAGEKKKEGVLRVDCVFRSWLLIALSRSAQEYSVEDSARRS